MIAAKDEKTENYNKEARKGLKQHIEQEFDKRKEKITIDWDRLWHALEWAAKNYHRDRQSLPIEPCSPTDTLAKLIEVRDLIDKLSWKLDNPALFNWHFISEAREPSDYFLKREPPNEQLDELRT